MIKNKTGLMDRLTDGQTDGSKTLCPPKLVAWITQGIIWIILYNECRIICHKMYNLIE